MAKTKEHLFNESYKEKVMVMGFSGKIGHRIEEDFICSNCGITKKHFDRLVNEKRIAHYKKTLKQLKNLPTDMRSVWDESDIKDTTRILATVKLAKDCSLYKNRIK